MQRGKNVLKLAKLIYAYVEVKVRDWELWLLQVLGKCQQNVQGETGRNLFAIPEFAGLENDGLNIKFCACS